MRKLLIFLSLSLITSYTIAQTKVQRGIARMITRSATDPIVPVQGVEVVVGNVAALASDKNGRFALSVPLNKDGSFSLTDVRIPKGRNLVWASPQKGKKQFLTKGDLDVAVATKEEKDAEYKKRYENLKAQYRAKVKELKAERDKCDDALIDIQATDARYARVVAERDSIQKLFTDYLTNKDKIDKWMAKMAEELSLVDYQSLDSLDRRLYELKCAGEWETINDLVNEFMGGDARQAFERIKENEQAADEEVAQRQLELAAAMQKQQDATIERERWFKMMEANIEALKMQYRILDVSDNYKMLTTADPTNLLYLDSAAIFELRTYPDGGEAVEYLKKYLKISIKNGTRGSLEIASKINLLGIAYNCRGEVESSKDCFEKALYIRKKELGLSNDDVIISYMNMAYIFYRMKLYAEAVNYCDSTLSLVEMLKDERQQYRYIELYKAYTSIYIEKRDFDNALLYCNNIQDILTKYFEDDKEEMNENFYRMGKIYEYNGNYGTSISYYKKSLEILSEKERRNDECIAGRLQTIGYVYLLSKDYRNSLIYLEKEYNLRIKTHSEEDAIIKRIKEDIDYVRNLQTNNK